MMWIKLEKLNVSNYLKKLYTGIYVVNQMLIISVYLTQYYLSKLFVKTMDNFEKVVSL